MRDVSIKLITKTYSFDSVGNQIDTEVEVDCPLIDIEEVYASEFYKASQQGMRPSKRFVISTLNYSNQNELKYMSQKYTVIRSEERNPDEVVLICEVKVSEH